MEIETLIRMQGESYTKDKHLERDARFRGRIESCPLWVSCSRPRRNRERRTFVIPSNETIARFFFPLSERKRYNRSIPPLFSQNFSFFFFSRPYSVAYLSIFDMHYFVLPFLCDYSLLHCCNYDRNSDFADNNEMPLIFYYSFFNFIPRKNEIDFEEVLFEKVYQCRLKIKVSENFTDRFTRYFQLLFRFRYSPISSSSSSSSKVEKLVTQVA